MKTYKFKSNGPAPQYCEHNVEYHYGCSLQINLMWQLINVYTMTLDKKIFSTYCDELGQFIENHYQLNQNGGWLLSHYSSVDMEGELLQMFLESNISLRK